MTTAPDTDHLAGHRAEGLASRSFTLLAAGQAASRIGDGMFATVLAWLALRSGGATAVAVVACAAAVPVLAGSLVAASYADRHDRRRIMIGADLVRLCFLLALAGVLVHGQVGVPVLACAAAAEGCAGAAFTPARLALVPDVVRSDSLLRANSVLQVSFMASFSIGPLLVGPVSAVTGMAGVVVVDAMTFAVSAATLAGIRVAGTSRTPVPVRLWPDLSAGWRAVRDAPDVALVLSVFVLALIFASGALAVGLPVWTARAHGGPGSLGLLQGSAGTAEMVGALVLSRLRLHRLAVTAVGAWTVLGGFRLFLGMVHQLAFGLPLMAGTGLASAATDVPLIALVQSSIPARHLAKAMALWYTGVAAALTVSPPLAALAIHAWGLTASFTASGLALVLTSGSALLRLTRRPLASRAHLEGGH